MALSRLQALLDVHGSDLARFPEPERSAARALLAADERAARMLAEAEALHGALAGLPPPEPSAALRRAVAEIPLRHPQLEGARSAFAWLPLRSAWALCASAALIVALGALTGALADGLDVSLSPEPQVEPAEEDDALTELSELAFAAELADELAP
jgi:hypothetical protein